MSADNIEYLCELSAVQQGILFHSVREPRAGAYVVQMACSIDGALDAAAFGRAWQRLVDAHAILRTSFVWEGVARPLQVVQRRVSFTLEQRDWTGLSEAQRVTRLDQYLEQDRRRGFELVHAPLMRATLFRVGESAHRFVWTHHHILLDGWSVALVLQSVLELYEAEVGGPSPPVRPTRPFADYVGWERAQDRSNAEAFWRRQLDGFAHPTQIGVEATSSARSTGRVGEQWSGLCAAETAELAAAARRHRVTLATVAQGAWGLLLSRYCGEEDVVFGTTVSTRPPERPGFESIVGLCINTLPVRLAATPELGLASWLSCLQAELVAARPHAHAALVDIQRWSEVPRGAPLFESIVAFENYPRDGSLRAPRAGLEVRAVRWFGGTNYPLAMIILPEAELKVSIAHDESRFSADVVARMLGHYCELLRAVTRGMDGTLGALSMLTAAERRRIIVEWNDTSAAPPRERGVHEMFEARARIVPGAVAVTCDNAELTYEALDRRANQLARYLRARGVGREVLVGVFIDRSLELLVALLAVWKAGGAFVPLDPSHPEDRVAFMLLDAEVPWVLTRQRLVPRLPLTRSGVIRLDADWPAVAEEAEDDVAGGVTPEDLAYVIYTSGSTGVPKGVMVPHRGLMNYLAWSARAYAVDVGAGAPVHTSVAFDLTLTALFTPLIAGRRVELLPEHDGAEALAKALRAGSASSAASLVKLTPSHVELLCDGVAPGCLSDGVRAFVVGGETLRAEHVDALRTAAPDAVIFNEYGPTEAVVGCCVYRVTESGPGPIPIGRPIDNTELYILDRQLSPVPIGVSGELYIGGVGLARGYLGRANLTATRFIPHPFKADTDARIYRTGDRARYRADGTIEFLGRYDRQVKIRGVRIEPAEIEQALESHPAVREAAVVVRERGHAGAELVACWVPRRAGEITVAALRRFLLTKLPAAMVPALFAELERFPLTSNGKTDRAALLAAPAAVPELEASFVAPRTPVEEQLAEIWAEVLDLDGVGVDDDFFELGGHSLSALRVLSRVRTRFRIELALAVLFEARTIAQLGVVVEQARGADGPARQLDRDAPTPKQRAEGEPSVASFAQQRLWLLEQLDPGNAVYNGNTAVRIEGPLDVAVLERSIVEVIRRHEILRTTFAVHEGGLLQVIAPASDLTFSVSQISLTGSSTNTRRAQAQRQFARWAREPFDLELGPLLRVFIARIDEREHALLLSVHHVISDGWSRDVLVRELAAFYDAGLRGSSAALPELPIQFADFAVWQLARARGPASEAQLSYWRHQLAGLTALELPSDRRRPAVRSFRGARRSFTLSASRVRAVEAFGLDNGVTAFVTLLAVFVTLLHRITAAEDIAVGAPVTERSVPETEGLIGPFINTVVLRCQLSKRTTFSDLVSHVQSVVLAAQAHKDVPFEQVVAEVGVRDESRTPLFQVLFDLQHASPNEPALPGLRLLPIEVDNGTAKVDLALHLWQVADGLSGSFEYSTDLFDDATIQRLVSYFQRLLEGIISDGGRPLSRLPLLADHERREMLIDWNDTAVDYPRGACLHRLFERQAERTPDAVAVVFERGRVDYRELNHRANQLAHRLRALGVDADSVVGVHLDRSVELVVALLAVLKAGGAYLPLPPDLPRARLEFMIEDAGASVLLTRASTRDLRVAGARRVNVDEAAPACPRDSEGPHASTTADALAYVIYTSGSTGRPKGVMIQHDAICNRLFWMQSAYQLTAADRVLHKTPFDFDVSVWEIFWPLITGARLVIARPGGHRDPPYLVDLIVAQEITTLHFIPSLLRAVLDEPGFAECDSLVRVVVSGEALPRELAEQFSLRSTAALHNLYGPTEASVDVTAWTWRRGARRVLIGRPIANIRTHILGPSREVLPIGVSGELYIGGVGLARGYIGQPALTAQRFVPDPFSTTPGARLYRTGDRCRYVEGGDIEFLGRLDDQVKIRGIRVEPGEIEAELTRHPRVRESVVVAREDEPGGARLCAYVVPGLEPHPSSAELRRHLGATLPDAMIPSVFITLEALPLTTSGKVDRRALPRPPAGRPSLDDSYVPPDTAEERALATIWSQVLDIDRVGVHDDFFALGGDSMRSIRVVALARDRGLSISLQRLFREPTIHALTRGAPDGERCPRVAPFELLRSEDRARVPVGVTDAYPLTELQLGMVFHDSYDPGARLYRNVDSVHVRGRFDPRILREVAQRLVERHEILRTSFDLSKYSEALQLVHERVEAPVTVDDLRDLSPSAQETHLAEWIERQLDVPIDVTTAPLFRLHVHWRGRDRFQLTLPHHHAILDGWSVSALFAELMADYLASVRGDDHRTPSIEASFRDYVALERRALEEPEHRRYWSQHLVGAPTSTVASFPDAGARSRDAADGSRHGQLEVELEPGLSSAVQRLAARAGVSRKSVLLSAHVRVLCLLTGRSEVVTGVATDGRLERPGGDRVLGLFLNSAPCRVALGGGTWLDLVREVFEYERGSSRFRHYPLSRMERDQGGRSLFDTLFNYTHFHVLDSLAELEGMTVLDRRSFARSSFRFVANFDVSAATDGLLSLTLAYDAAEFSAEQVDGIGDLYRRTLTAMTSGPSRRYESDYQLSPDERRMLVEIGNDTRRDYPRNSCVHRLFEARARIMPDAPAIRLRDERVSYAELDRRANRLARRLRSLGVGPEIRVGVCLERSIEMVVGILAVLKAGGAYVPCDPNHPEERVAFMLRDAGAMTVLTQRRFAEALVGEGRRVLILDDATADEGQDGAPVDDGGATAENLAYVMYTSGSTGAPKGVCINHRSVARLVLGVEYAQLDPDKVVLQLASIAFDASTFELWGALLNGSSLALLDPHQPSLAELAAAIERYDVTTMFLTPAVFNPLVEAHLGAFGRVREVLVGGDVVSPAHALELARAHSGCRVINGYGPTESTTFACCWPLLDPEQRLRSVPIGRPIANTRVYVLDAQLEPVPFGVPGELHIGGDGLAREYLNLPNLTHDRFVPDPFGPEPGGRLYRTGDMVRRLPSGDLEFSGRVDRQVKIRGVRVELGEVEAVLCSHPAVREVVTELRGHPSQLTAYVVFADGEECRSSELRAFVRRKLPDAMVPSVVVALVALPLTASGKLDRAALPVPTHVRPELGPALVPPRTPHEEILATIWSDLLGLDRAGVHDDFFELGGNSLIATQVISRVRDRFQTELPLRALFDAPTISGLATAVVASRRAERRIRAGPIAAIQREGPAPLTIAQEQLFELHRALRGMPLFNMPARLHLDGPLEPSLLAQSFEELAARHEALRTTFELIDGRPMQVIAPEPSIELTLTDLRVLPSSDRVVEAERIAHAEARAPFDLARGPLLRAGLLRLDEHEHVLLVTIHHILGDGWSMGVMMRELAALYESLVTGSSPPLPSLRIQYADFAVWQAERLAGGGFDAELAYWKRELAAPRRGPVVVHGSGSDGLHGLLTASVPVGLPMASLASLKALATEQSMSLFMVLLAIFGVFLHHATKRDDIRVGTLVANRTLRETEDLIGLFINTVVLSIDLSGDPTFAEILRCARDKTLAAYDHQDVPFEAVLRTLLGEGSPERSSVFQAMLIVQNAPIPSLSVPGLEISRWQGGTPPPPAPTGVDLTLSLEECRDGLTGALIYSTSRFDAETIVELQAGLERLLTVVAGRQHGRLSELCARINCG